MWAPGIHITRAVPFLLLPIYHICSGVLLCSQGLVTYLAAWAGHDMVPSARGGGEGVWTGWSVASPQGPDEGHKAKLTILTCRDRMKTAAVAFKIPIEVFSYLGV